MNEQTIEYAKKANGEDYNRNDLIDAPLWWQQRGLHETKSGYGSRLTTSYKLLHDGKMKRVYCICYSNTGTLYVFCKGKRLYLHI